MAGPSEADLDKLIRGTKEAMRKLDAPTSSAARASASLDAAIRDSDESLRRVRSWKAGQHPLTRGERFKRFLGANKGRLGEIAFAGIIFGLAVERMIEKSQTQTMQQQVLDEKERLESAVERLNVAAAGYERREGELASSLEEALSAGTWGLAKATRRALEAHRARVAEDKTRLDEAVGALGLSDDRGDGGTGDPLGEASGDAASVVALVGTAEAADAAALAPAPEVADPIADPAGVDGPPPARIKPLRGTMV